MGLWCVCVCGLCGLVFLFVGCVLNLFVLYGYIYVYVCVCVRESVGILRVRCVYGLCVACVHDFVCVRCFFMRICGVCVWREILLCRVLCGCVGVSDIACVLCGFVSLRFVAVFTFVVCVCVLCVLF